MDVNASHDNLDENMVEELEMGEEDIQDAIDPVTIKLVNLLYDVSESYNEIMDADCL